MPLHQAAPRHAGTLTVLVVALSAVAWAQFETRSSSAIIYEPQAVAVGDFNHDGKLDIAAAAWYTGQVAVLLGNGNGTFQPAVYYDLIDSSAVWLAAADFRGNGNLDLAVADEGGQNISILLGNGDGTFQPPVPYPTTQLYPTYVAVGDFNNDGKPDLIIDDTPYVSVMLGNGDGTFQPPIDTTIFSPIFSGIPFALGDFNHDGNLDVAVLLPVDNPGEPQIGILLGNGDGTFRQGAQYAGTAAGSITVGDFNGDHNLDLAVAEAGYPIQIMLGNGDGTFQFGATYESSQPAAPTTADVNGDGKLDLLFISTTFPSALTQLTVMLGNGDGTFQPPLSYGSFDEAQDIAVGDFNGDHKPDVAIANFRGEAVTVLLNTGVVSFSPTTPISFPTQLVGTTSAPQNVTLTNTGTTALSIASKRVSGPFQLASGTTCGSSVAPGANCTLSVAFAPTVIGFKSGLLSLSDSASSKPQVIELSGTGTVITVSPTQLNFGSQKVGTKSAPQNVTVTNTGSTAVSVTSVKIIGGASQDYSETNNCGSQIAPGASCTVKVIFEPTRTGPRAATLEINDSGGGSPQQVPLTGTGI
jgi:FG-GAP-like repeat/Cep192 domain 4/Abnormal spindle-like microcephaly-assoc'd, ASPM-SPD-2-Hydin/FG-GAP repeat